MAHATKAELVALIKKNLKLTATEAGEIVDLLREHYAIEKKDTPERSELLHSIPEIGSQWDIGESTITVVDWSIMGNNKDYVIYYTDRDSDYVYHVPLSTFLSHTQTHS